MEKQPEEEDTEGDEIWEENNVISFDEEKQDLFEEEKLNTNEEEIIDFFEEEKINIIDEEDETKEENEIEEINEISNENSDNFNLINSNDIISYKCPVEYIKLPIDKIQCINKCNLVHNNKFEINNICYAINPIFTNRIYYCDILCSEKNIFKKINNQDFNIFFNIDDIIYLSSILTNNAKQEEIYSYNKILEKIEESLTSKNYDTSDLDEGEEQCIKFNKMKISFSTTEKQKSNINKNITALDFTECENVLRTVYNISDDKKLYMRKIDIEQDKMKIPKILYDVYSKLNSTNLIKLNLSFCHNKKIDLFVPVIISNNENMDEYNTSSGYYNDICYKIKSKYNTDILIKDRQKEYIKYNKTLCQENCEFIEYNYNIKKAKCSCNVKGSFSSPDDFIINSKELLNNFKDIKSKANIDFIFCYKILFSKEGIIYNIGFYILISVIIFHVIIIIIFYIKGLDKIKDIIELISYGINNKKLLTRKENETKNENIKSGLNSIITTGLNKIKKRSKSIINKNKKKKSILIENKNENIKMKKNIRNINANSNMSISNNINKKRRSQNSTNILFNKIKLSDKTKLEKTKKIMEPNKQEINQYLYEYAIKFDDRSFCEYYISLIQTKHALIFSFYYNNDYNSKIMKIDLFFVNFIINYTISALFFTDKTIHQIYEDKGKYKILYQLPQIIYSTIISSILNTILKLFALSENSILDFKKNKDKDNDKKTIKKLKQKLINKLNIKFILYFIISSIILILFWYYLSLFCSIYENTQIFLIKDTLISFGLSLLYPLGLYLLPVILRISALSNKNNERICLYNFSKFLQKIL